MGREFGVVVWPGVLYSKWGENKGIWLKKQTIPMQIHIIGILGDKN